tara:strand:- start:183 stop:362 length:180 start_codon:yes stop_codon:yes gene_type:complete
MNKKMDWGDWFERTIWTAVEAGLAILVVTDVSSLKAAGAAVAAAGIASVKSLAKAKLGR